MIRNVFSVLATLLGLALLATPMAIDYYIIRVSDCSWFIKIPVVCLTTVVQIAMVLGYAAVAGDEDE